MLLCDYVMEEFAPTWLNYSSDGAELAAGSKRKHREYLAHLSHAFFWKYHLTKITTEDINRWLSNLDNFGGATPPAIMVPTGPLIAEATAVNAAARAAGLTEEAAKSAAANPTVKSM